MENDPRVKKELRLIVFVDDSISIYDGDECVTFFDTSTIVAEGLIENLKEMGNL